MPRIVAAQPKLAKASQPGRWARLASSKVLLISIAVHLLFAAGAGYIIVQNVAAKRKMTFTGGPPTTNPSKRALEHQVAMGKKKNMMSAPAQAKRITTTGLARVALPEMPAMPALTDVMPGRITELAARALALARRWRWTWQRSAEADQLLWAAGADEGWFSSWTSPARWCKAGKGPESGRFSRMKWIRHAWRRTHHPLRTGRVFARG